MEFIWHILLTVCMSNECRYQDVQWFEGPNAQTQCNASLQLYKDIPNDGDWDTVTWECKPLGSKQT